MNQTDSTALTTSTRRQTSRPRRAWAFVLALGIFILAFDQIIGLILRSVPPIQDPSIGEAADVRNLYSRMIAGEQTPWLLIGDSVLAGDALAGREADYQHKRVLDFMRSQIGPDEKATFHQLAFNGLLPVDAVRFVRELDRLDPKGKVAVALEINPRYFSKYYANQTACTREWVNNLAPRLEGSGSLSWSELVRHRCNETLDWIADRMPIYRHLKFLPVKPVMNENIGIFTRVDPEKTAPPPGKLEGMARMLEHYQDLDLGAESAQVGALNEISGRLAKSHRRALIFHTPINDQFADQAASARVWGDYYADISRLVEIHGMGRVTLTNLDHPLFTPPLFVDHCHLISAGNRLLAINLLHEMNFTLAEVPDSNEMVYPEDRNFTYAYNVNRGYCDGPPWLAKFNEPGGVAVDSTCRVVIADTLNHCLREIGSDGQTTRILAGRPLEAGHADGIGRDAMLDHPTAPCLMGDKVYFADGEGKYLRCCAGNRVQTEESAGGENWTKITEIRQRNELLYLLDQNSRILEYDPRQRVARVVVLADPGSSIRAFDVALDGRIFFANEQNQISVVSEGGAPKIWFANDGKAATVGFPVSFGGAHLEAIKDIRWIAPYDGILVQDEHPFQPPTPNVPPDYVTERVHLRFLRCADNMVYLWMKTQVFPVPIVGNGAYSVEATSFDLGVMAVEQRSATLFYAEKTRSRLYRIEDGLWAAAKTGTGQYTTPSTEGAMHVLTELHPEKLIGQRIERLTRPRTYCGILYGSSLMGMTEMLPTQLYSTTRAIERRLKTLLGYHDALRIEIAESISNGQSIGQATEAVEFCAANGRMDFFIIEVYPLFLGADFLDPERVTFTEEQILNYLGRIRAAAARYNSRVIFLDNTGMWSEKREGLRPAAKSIQQFLQLVRDQGFEVVAPENPLVRDYLDTFPWGSPPYFGHHASPMALEAAARKIADEIYPILRADFMGRVPAMNRPPAPEPQPVDTSRFLTTAYETLKLDPQSLDLIQFDSRAIRKDFSDGNLSLFIDLTKVPEYGHDPSPRQLDRIAVSALSEMFSRKTVGATATKVTLKLALFSNYDEYGRGVREGAKIIDEKTFDRDSLVQFLTRAAADLKR